MTIDSKARVIFVTHFRPTPVGNGGNHRAYQILHDLEELVGPQSVMQLVWPEWQRNHLKQRLGTSNRRPSIVRLRRVLRALGLGKARDRLLNWQARLRHRLSLLFVDDVLDFLSTTRTTWQRFSDPDFANHYRSLLSQSAVPTVCVIEHVGFSDLLPINAAHNVPTISCVQNIESFDSISPVTGASAADLRGAALDFSEEYRVLAQCDIRLFISKVEAGLIGGLGAASGFYPYLPVGRLRRSLETIRLARRAKHGQPGLFLMLGTGAHEGTKASFERFLHDASVLGLPEDVRLVVVGEGTDRLQQPIQPARGIDLRGWVEQEELERLLIEARAVLVPQICGFGALTRVPELACAGVPTIVSTHPSYALDLPPGSEVVGDDWNSWSCMLAEMARSPSRLDPVSYELWERRFPNSLQSAVAQLVSARVGSMADRRL